MRLALANVLTRGGHEVLQAADGPAALERVAQGGVDLVLLDMRLPEMDGVEILRRIRESHSDLPVIMVTGYGHVDSAVEVMKLGASHYLAKPFSNKELLEAAQAVLDAGGRPIEGPLRRRLAEKTWTPGGAGLWKGHLRWAWAAALGVAALALWGGVRSAAKPDSYPIPYKHPVAMVWIGDRLWTADWFSQTVHEHRFAKGRFETVRSVHLPQSHITGLSVVNETLYLADSWKRVVQRRRLDAGLTLVETIPSPGPSPSGLFWDGRYLWSSDSSNQRFYQHDLDRELTVLASYKTPGRTPAGVFKDSRFFWSVDSDTRIVYQHRLDNLLRVVAKYTLPNLDIGKEALSCFSWREGHIWVGRDGIPKLYRYRLEDFRRHPGG